MEQVRNSMRKPVLIDGRNIYEASIMNHYGFIYRGIGRGTGRSSEVLPPEDTTTALTEQSLLEEVK